MPCRECGQLMPRPKPGHVQAFRCWGCRYACFQAAQAAGKPTEIDDMVDRITRDLDAVADAMVRAVLEKLR